MSTVDLDNKDIKRYIERALSLPKTDGRSPYTTIPRDQYDLYKWAKAYEELEPLVSDHIYDMFTRYLQREQIMFPVIWDEVSLTCFEDESWKYTGLFIEGHIKEDEDWLL